MEQRRARVVARHHLDGSAADAVQATRDLVVLHATDPATVYLSLLSRCAGLSLKDVSHVLYDDRALVRMMAMRRTLFVVPLEHAGMVHHAASLEIAVRARKQLLQQLSTLPTEPPLPQGAALAAWLEDVERSVEAAAIRRGTSLATELSTDEPRLRTAILPSTGKAWDVRRNITTQVLVLMGTEGRLVRAIPRGGWTSRSHTWEPGATWWPAGIPEVPDARVRLVERYLRRFGPATVTDVQWWTGWTLGATRAALAALETVDVGCGLVLADDAVPEKPAKPTATLLPALDPTAMGWKEREWYLPADWQPLYDRNGNIGPTVWWGGEIIGGWSVRGDGSIATRLLVDRGAAAERAVRRAAAALEPRFEGTRVVPSFPTPLEKELRGS